MRFFYIALGSCALLAPSTSAFPQLEARGQDSCAKAVSCGPASPPKNVAKTAAAKSDCSSFLRKTVSPCPITSTTTKFCTKTAKAITKTSTKLATKTATVTSTALRTNTQTISSTQQTTQSTTVEVPIPITTITNEVISTTTTIFQTLSLTATSTDTISSTVVVTTTLTPVKKRETVEPVKKRETVDLSLHRLPKGFALSSAAPEITGAAESGSALDARGYQYQCRPSTSSAQNVPKYASACRGPAAYTSACQKLGVGVQTTTLKPSTTYITKSSTTTITPTALATTTTTIQQTVTQLTTQFITKPTTVVSTVTKTETFSSTSIMTLTLTITSVVPITLTGTTFTATTIGETTTEVVTSVTTVTPTPFPSCTFTAQVSGASAGQYLRIGTDGVSGSPAIEVTNDPANQAKLALDAQNRLYSTSDGQYLNINNQALFVIYLNSASEISSGGYLYLNCDTTSGQLRCSTSSGQSVFYYCTGRGTGANLLFGYPEQTSCSVLTLTPSCV